MKNLEIIEKYFNGLLNKEEKAVFEQELRSDESLRSDVAHYIQLKQALINGQLMNRHSEWKQQKKTKSLSLRTIFSFAAVLVIALGGIWYWTIAPSVDLASQAHKYIEQEFQQRSIQMSAGQDSLQQAIALFNEGKLEASYEITERLHQSQPDNAEQLELLGITALRLEEYEKALTYFRKMEKMDLFDNPSVFYQAITLLKRKAPLDQQEAEKLLNRVKHEQLGGKQYAQQWLDTP